MGERGIEAARDRRATDRPRRPVRLAIFLPATI